MRIPTDDERWDAHLEHLFDLGWLFCWHCGTGLPPDEPRVETPDAAFCLDCAPAYIPAE